MERVAFWLYHRPNSAATKKIAKEIIYKAELESDTIKKAGEIALKQNQIEQQKDLKQIWQNERRKIQREEERLKQREDKLESRMNLVEKKLSDIEKREAVIIGRKAQLDKEKKACG